MELDIAPSALDAIERFTKLKLKIHKTGEVTLAEKEQLGSYAAEALARILIDNPDKFRYWSTYVKDSKEMNKR